MSLLLTPKDNPYLTKPKLRFVGISRKNSKLIRLDAWFRVSAYFIILDTVLLSSWNMRMVSKTPWSRSSCKILTSAAQKNWKWSLFPQRPFCRDPMSSLPFTTPSLQWPWIWPLSCQSHMKRAAGHTLNNPECPRLRLSCHGRALDPQGSTAVKAANTIHKARQL